MGYIPAEELRAICDGFKGKCTLYVSLPFAGETFSIRAEEPMIAASTIKIPLLALLFKDAQEGHLELDSIVPMAPENRVKGSGILKYLDRDIRLSLYDYAVLMMIVSDNSATNHIIDVVGKERANAFFAENGWMATSLQRKLFVSTADDSTGTPIQNHTSAANLGNMLERILAGELVSKDACDKMMSIMACQTLGKFNGSLPGVLRPQSTREPLGPIPEGSVILVQKGGTLKNRVSHDAAIMLLPNGRHAVMVMMTESTDNALALEAIQKVSRAIYDRLAQ